MHGWVVLSSRVHTELTAILVLGTGLLAVWCFGRVRAYLYPVSPLVGVITEEAFTGLLGAQGVEPRLAATTYRYLREMQGVPVPLLPGDHLIWDLGLSEPQVEQTVTDLARRLQRYSSAQPLSRLPHTVDDLVRFLQAMPGQQPAPGARAA